VVVSLLAVSLPAGCAGGAAPRGPVSPSPSTVPTSPSTSGVSALSFDLPTAPKYSPDGTRVGDDGQIVRTWRARPVKGGDRVAACVVVAGEQPGFTGSFPAAARTAFGLGHEDGSEIQYNEAAPAIAGTTAGLRQARSYRFSLGVRGTATGVLMVRQYLTTQRTLISLDVAGPADSAALCGLQGIVDSLRVASPGDRTPALLLPSVTPSVTPSGTSSAIATRPSGAESTP
jgi:hypothetical protein